MAKCDYCGKELTMPYTCAYCGETFCPKHRLPENHSCEGLDKISEESEDRGRVYRGISKDLEEGTQNKDTDEDFSDLPIDFSRRNSERRSERNYNESPFEGVTRGLLSILKSLIFSNTAIILILIMIIFYIGQGVLLSLGSSGLYKEVLAFLAPSRANVLTRPWTLVTSIFLHDIGNPLHLIVNGLVLFFLGPALERRIGRKRFLYMFFGGGVLASSFQLLLMSGNNLLVGASGAIFGVLGALTVISPRMPVLLFFILPLPLWMITLGFGIYNIGEALLVENQVANIAHLAGLGVGLAYGYKLKKEIEKKFKRFDPSSIFRM